MQALFFGGQNFLNLGRCAELPLFDFYCIAFGLKNTEKI
jgi:hypothetical protein